MNQVINERIQQGFRMVSFHVKYLFNSEILEEAIYFALEPTYL